MRTTIPPLATFCRAGLASSFGAKDEDFMNALILMLITKLRIFKHRRENADFRFDIVFDVDLHLPISPAALFAFDRDKVGVRKSALAGTAATAQ